MATGNFSQNADRSEAGAVVPPAVLQLKRLTRDLQQRVAEFRVLLQATLGSDNPPDAATFQFLAAEVERMRRDLRTSDSIAEASVAAIARQDPGELHTLRDQLLGYLAVLAEAAPAPALSATNDNPPISSDRP